jgi:hypothetical protein
MNQMNSKDMTSLQAPRIKITISYTGVIGRTKVTDIVTYWNNQDCWRVYFATDKE